MHILILNWRDPKNPKSGGAEYVTLQHAKAWIKAGHTVVWLTSSFTGAKADEVIEEVHIVRRLGCYSIYLFAPFFYLFSKEKFDIVIDELHGVPFFTPLYVRKPKILFVHEIPGEIWQYMYPFPISTIGKTFEFFYLSIYRNTLVWTDAPSTIEELVENRIPKKNCVAIPCPIRNVSKNHPGKKEKFPTFIFVSRVVKMKGIEEIIKAFGFILREEPHAQLWIVGGGEPSYIRKLQVMLKEYGATDNAIFFGKVSEEKKIELLSKAHILLHASVKEGWGLVVLEAASQATPSVVYNVSGLRDSVQHNKTGIVLQTNSAREMAQEALQLLYNKKTYHMFQENGLHRVKNLRWENVTKDSLSLLQRAV